MPTLLYYAVYISCFLLKSKGKYQDDSDNAKKI